MELINLKIILIILFIVILLIIYNLRKKISKHESQIFNMKKDLDNQYNILDQLSREIVNFDSEESYFQQTFSNNQEKILLDFQNYLIKNNYCEFTPSGNPSTVYDYSKSRIPKICKRENITLLELAHNITKYVNKYDIGGEDSDFGAKSNRAYINALKCFQKYLNEFNSLEDLPLNELNNTKIDTSLIFKTIYEGIFKDIESGKIKLIGETQLSIVNNRIGFGGDKRSENKKNINLLFDYFVKSKITDVKKYDKDDWFVLISKLTQGKTKTIDYIYYRDFIQEILNRFYKK